MAEIQAALRAAKLDDWLFYDFRHSDPLAYRILKLDEKMLASRRWFYYVPASGEPVKIVQSIEQFKLDSLPGRKLIFRGWQELHARLKEVLGASGKESKRRIAMQYSPMNDIPYISRVDAGTIELVRSFGVEPVSSAELVQRFEAVFSPAQHEMHVEASDKMHGIIQDAFAEIARRIRADEPTTEWDIAQFMLSRYKEEGMEQEPMIVAVNANAANPHYMPTKDKSSPIKRGDFVLIDAATKLNKPDAVATDQTWTGYVGESVPKEYSRIFNIVREARDAAVDFVRKNIRAGKPIRGAEVDDVSRGVITRAGFRRTIHTSHRPFDWRRNARQWRQHRRFRDARFAPYHSWSLFFHRAGNLARRKIRRALGNQRLRLGQRHRSHRATNPTGDHPDPEDSVMSKACVEPTPSSQHRTGLQAFRIWAPKMSSQEAL